MHRETSKGQARSHPKRTAGDAETEALCASALEAVHLMASSLRVDRSTSTAVRFAARHGSEPVRRAFERLEWEVQVRHHPTLDEALFALASRVGRHGPAFKRALLTLQAAESERTRDGLERRLDRALDIITKDEDQRLSGLAGTLERPVSMLLGLGVVLPLVIVSLMPLLHVAHPSFGALGSALLLLVVVPVATLIGASRILDSHTLAHPPTSTEMRLATVAGTTVLACGSIMALLGLAAPGSLPVEPPFLVSAAAAAGSAMVGTWLWRSAREGAAVRETAEAELPDLLHAVGSRMTAGRPAEQALLESVASAEASVLTEHLRGVLFDVVVGRRDLGDAIARDEGIQACGRAAPALRLMATAARRDAAEAGRVVQHLAEFERLRLDASVALRNRVRSVVDTARTTAVVFAPLILGVTAGMYGLLSTVPAALANGSRAAPDSAASLAFALTVALYVVIEAVIVEWFAARLLGGHPTAAFGRSLARDLPVAALLFGGAFFLAGRLF